MMAIDQPRSVLLRLIQEGEAILQRRQIDGEAASELCAAVERLRRVPADDARLIDDHTTIYAKALALAGKHFAAHQNERGRRYALVVGVLIDDIRDDFSEAVAQASRPSA